MANTRLPVHVLASSASTGTRDDSYSWISLLTATSVSLWAVPLAANQGEAVRVAHLPCSLTYTPPASAPQGQETDRSQPSQLAFPRIVSFAPDATAIAVAGDDKILRVWQLPTNIGFSKLVEASPSLLAYGSEALTVRLPKRAAVFLWEPTRSQGALHLIVGDRHGDVRSLPIPQEGTVSLAPQTKDEDETDMGFFDPMDPLSPRVGHVGMLTDAVFAPLPVSSSYTGPVPPLLLTADRDEHIRVSRWGPKRSGWTVEHFVLGSLSFVGALLIVPYPPALANGRKSALLSADGGTALRVSDYLPNYPAFAPAPQEADKFLINVELDPSTLAPFIRTDVLPAPARRLIRLPTARSDDALPPIEERDSIRGYPHLAIVQLALLSVPGNSPPTHAFFRLEASTALHILSLDSIYQGKNDLWTIDLGRPIVHAIVTPQGDKIYVSLDTRAALSPGTESVEGQDLLAFQLSSEGILVPLDAGLSPAQMTNDASRPTVDTLGKHRLVSLDLYPALSSFPKTSSDGSATKSDSPEARIRASIASGRRAAGRGKNLRALFGDQEAGP